MNGIYFVLNNGKKVDLLIQYVPQKSLALVIVCKMKLKGLLLIATWVSVVAFLGGYVTTAYFQEEYVKEHGEAYDLLINETVVGTTKLGGFPFGISLAMAAFALCVLGFGLCFCVNICHGEDTSKCCFVFPLSCIVPIPWLPPNMPDMFTKVNLPWIKLTDTIFGLEQISNCTSELMAHTVLNIEHPAVVPTGCVDYYQTTTHQTTRICCLTRIQTNPNMIPLDDIYDTWILNKILWLMIPCMVIYLLLVIILKRNNGDGGAGPWPAWNRFKNCIKRGCCRRRALILPIQQVQNMNDLNGMSDTDSVSIVGVDGRA